VEYSGEVSKLKLEPVTLAVLKGLLTPALEDDVNYVNAPLIAKDRGIEVKVTTRRRRSSTRTSSRSG